MFAKNYNTKLKPKIDRIINLYFRCRGFGFKNFAIIN